MLGFGDKQEHIESDRLPVFVHAVQNTESFTLAQKVWDNNGRYIMLDSVNGKELMHFVFSRPTCVVWLQRDKGRSDTYELILVWEGSSRQDGITEIYVLSPTSGAPIGDDRRAKNLLNAILSSPSIVPVNPERYTKA
jgi:hypothetical protein